MGLAARASSGMWPARISPADATGSGGQAKGTMSVPMAPAFPVVAIHVGPQALSRDHRYLQLATNNHRRDGRTTMSPRTVQRGHPASALIRCGQAW